MNKPLTLKQKLDAQATVNFRRQLFQRAIQGEAITVGAYYIYTDGYTVMDRKAKQEDVDLVLAAKAKVQV